MLNSALISLVVLFQIMNTHDCDLGDAFQGTGGFPNTQTKSQMLVF